LPLSGSLSLSGIIPAFAPQKRIGRPG